MIDQAVLDRLKALVRLGGWIEDRITDACCAPGSRIGDSVDAMLIFGASDGAVTADLNAALSHIAELEAKLAEAREIIQPFGDYMRSFDQSEWRKACGPESQAFDDDKPFEPADPERGWLEITYGDLRRAASFIGEGGE